MGKLYESVNMMQLGAMPPRKFLALHPDVSVTPQDLAVIKNYLAPWSSDSRIKAVSSPPIEQVPFQANLALVAKEMNGLAFDPDVEDWKPISFTDRGDNNSMRMILGNEIAVKAAQSGNVSPWPDGARLAKIAWQRVAADDGLIHPGKFVQVELMVKNAHLYKGTDGWGWGRWRGTALTHYGSNSHFVRECTSCHLPMRGNDSIYTLPITSAKSRRNEVLNYKAAALPRAMPYQPLDWRAITMYIDPVHHTMATLYGNDVAAKAVRNHAVNSIAKAYPPGAVLVLITWVQREDPHWFGGRIPDVPESVEFVQSNAPGSPSEYKLYKNFEKGEHKVPAEVAMKRTEFITSLAPAWLP
ncbi:hypothetical protein GCM10011507_02960 [Edaphobacter acidisoli]|uniref:Cytochrome P460 domain-containing protein n=2 Tax=Edaphobacter acidisoli TaxID=2040573 RepID=A0A916REU7_9BACT|nr:hypothetical protein GCM10011507_02960 [Edaphobacter acidisoli]